MSDLLNVHIGEGQIIFLAPRSITIGDEMIRLFKESFFKTLISNGFQNVVLDLSMCNDIDSAGIGMLVTSFTACFRNNGLFSLNRCTTKFRDFLKLSKLDQVLTITDIDYSGLEFIEISPQRLIAHVSGILPSPVSLKIFLCHASEDKSRVRDLYMRLRADGFTPWLDEEDLLPGQEWGKEIPKAVRESDVVIVSLSQRAVGKSGYINKELGFALDIAEEKVEGAIFIIPLKLEECDIPARLRRWQCVNFFEGNGYERLCLSLKFIRDTLRGS